MIRVVTLDTPVYRSAQFADCEERAFVLKAVGIESVLVRDPEAFAVLVDVTTLEAARAHLERYEQERRAPPSEPPPPPEPYGAREARAGVIGYILVLLGVPLAIALGFGPLDAFDRGVLDVGAVRDGEWWRAWTALTLHSDIAHLASNLGFGAWIGWLASRRIGPGHAYALAVLAAGAANLLEGAYGPAAHLAIGASTLVFAMLGTLMAHTWRERLGKRERWARRWGPLVVGVMLLGWTGGQSEDGTTDVVAHVLGFGVGALAGAAAARARIAAGLRTVPQWLSGSLALAIVLGSWALATASRAGPP
jgi:membrane associated rhomboid family serine protease